MCLDEDGRECNNLGIVARYWSLDTWETALEWRMFSKDDRKATLVLVGLATVGLVVRLSVGGVSPGSVFYRAQPDERPSQRELAAQADRLGRPLEAGERINIDRADAVELTRLPRIGSGLAARIVADRESRGSFGSLAGLDRVAGVGPTVLEAVAPYAEFSGEVIQNFGPFADSVLRINTATVEQLTRLPGIGPAKAEAIVQYRIENGPFRTLADLEGVKGIGPAILKQLRLIVKVP